MPRTSFFGLDPMDMGVCSADLRAFSNAYRDDELSRKYMHGNHQEDEVLCFDEDAFPHRARVAKFQASAGYRLGLVLLTALLWIAMIQDTDGRAQQRTKFLEKVGNLDQFVHEVNPVSMGIQIVTVVLFCADTCLRFFVERETFMHDKSNILDLAVIVAEVFLMVVPLSQELRVGWLRIFRVLRVVRLFGMHSFKEIYLMMQGLKIALRPIFFGIFLIAMCLVLWGILAVEFVHVDNLRLNADGVYGDCPDYVCKDAFSSVWAACLTMFKTIVAGDSWGQLSLPLLKDSPGHVVILTGSLLMIQIGLMSLIVAVIVDRAAEARQRDDMLLLAQKKENFVSAYKELKLLFEKMDRDGGGTLSIAELREAYDAFPEFQQILDALDIRKKELHVLFEIIDSDNNQEVSFEEFAENLHDMRERNSLTLLTFVRHNTTKLIHTMMTATKTINKQRAEFAELHRVLNDMRKRMDVVSPDLDGIRHDTSAQKLLPETFGDIHPVKEQEKAPSESSDEELTARMESFTDCSSTRSPDITAGPTEVITTSSDLEFVRYISETLMETIATDRQDAGLTVNCNAVAPSIDYGMTGGCVSPKSVSCNSAAARGFRMNMDILRPSLDLVPSISVSSRASSRSPTAKLSSRASSRSPTAKRRGTTGDQSLTKVSAPRKARGVPTTGSSVGAMVEVTALLQGERFTAPVDAAPTSRPSSSWRFRQLG